MATNWILDDKLIIQAQKISRHRTKKETVTMALKQTIALKKQKEIIGSFGKIEFKQEYD